MTGVNGQLYTIIFNIVIIATAVFAVVFVINYIITKKPKLLVYDDEKHDFFRIGKTRFKKLLFSNFFFYFFITLVAAGTAMLYT